MLFAYRYVVPAERQAEFEAELQRQQQTKSLAALTAKAMYCSLPVPVLKKLEVKRFLQLPGHAVVTYPVSTTHPPIFESHWLLYCNAMRDHEHIPPFCHTAHVNISSVAAAIANSHVTSVTAASSPMSLMLHLVAVFPV